MCVGRGSLGNKWLVWELILELVITVQFVMHYVSIREYKILTKREKETERMIL